MPEAQALEAAREQPADLRLEERLAVTQRLVHRSGDDVGEQLRVVGIDRLRVDLDLDDVAAGGRRHLHRPAARARGHRLAGGLLLHALELLLHLHRLLGELREVHVHRYSSSRASNVLFISSTISSSVAGRSASAAGRSRSSPTANTSASRRPVTSYSASRSRSAFFASSATPRWNDAAGGNSSVSVSSASPAGCASASIAAAGI